MGYAFFYAFLAMKTSKVFKYWLIANEYRQLHGMREGRLGSSLLVTLMNSEQESRGVLTPGISK